MGCGIYESFRVKMVRSGSGYKNAKKVDFECKIFCLFFFKTSIGFFCEKSIDTIFYIKDCIFLRFFLVNMVNYIILIQYNDLSAMIQERSIKNFTVCILSVQILRLNCDFLQEKLDNIQIFWDLEIKAVLYQCIRLYRVDLYVNL